MNGTIKLIRTDTGWSAQFSGQAAEEIRSLFCTDTIPTAFTAAAPAADVAFQISRNWPQCLVTVDVTQ